MITLEKHFKFLIIGIIGASSITFLVLVQLGLFASTDPNANFCTECSESVTTISVTVDYGNGTINTWSGISLENSRTSVFDAINKCCTVTYRIYGVNQDTYYVDSINGLAEDLTHGWEYWVNGVFSFKGANLHPLENGATVVWNYTTGSL